MHSEPKSEDEATLAGSFEEEINTQEECLISFQLSRPTEELSQDGQFPSEDESTVMSPGNKPKKRLTPRGREEDVGARALQ